MADLLAEQEARPADLIPVDPTELSPFQRSLLVIDGTVTKFIEAYCLEPVEVTVLAQEDKVLDRPSTWLDAPAGCAVISRQVVLRGAQSGRLYAYAASRLVHDRLPSFLREQLMQDPHGIGHILLESRLETFREVLWFGREAAMEAPPTPLASWSGQPWLSRAYRIFAARRPLMVIKEMFPFVDQ